MEDWKPIKGYEDIYEISSLGRVRSKNSDDISTYDNGYGWLIVELYKESGKCHKEGYSKRGAKRFKLHRLVAEHFIPNIHNYRFVCPLDGNKHNCTVDNLRWCFSNRGGGEN